MRMFLYPYKLASGSARNLSSTLNIKRIKPTTGSVYTPRVGDLIINFGASTVNFELTKPIVLNKPVAVSLASNKLFCFNKLQECGVNTPEYTTDVAIAQAWDCKVVARTKLQGCGGEGIEVFESGSDISGTFKMYSKYVKKTKEYRVHVFKDPHGVYTTPRVQVKKLSRHIDIDPLNTLEIRNYTNGWVFSSRVDRDNNNEWSNELLTESIKAVEALGLDFGAVDIIFNKIRGVFVLEVNTAPGMEGDTLEIYTSYFKQYKESL